jgi:hypothetical protein
MLASEKQRRVEPSDADRLQPLTAILGMPPAARTEPKEAMTRFDSFGDDQPPWFGLGFERIRSVGTLDRSCLEHRKAQSQLFG